MSVREEELGRVFCGTDARDSSAFSVESGELGASPFVYGSVRDFWATSVKSARSNQALEGKMVAKASTGMAAAARCTGDF